MPKQYALAAVLCGLALVSLSCRKETSADASNSVPPAALVPELQRNGLGSLPGAVYRNQADSAIHWQPWTKDSLQHAKEARRLVFCVIAMPQYPAFQKVLSALAEDPAMLATIHDHYVPVLVDGDAAREIGLLTADLSAEIKRPLQSPMFVWMTCEGNPVAWIPVNRQDPAGVAELFRQCHSIVASMWKDTPDYMLKNSAQDNVLRRNRLAQRTNIKVMSEQPAADVVGSIRRITSLYDPVSRTFDDIGRMFPAGVVDLLATAAVHPGLPPDVRTRALETTRELMVDLLPSAMFDPLDGGVSASRRGASWSMPSFARDCPSQARAALALLQAYRATANPQVLATALGVIAFAEKSYATPEGLFAVGLTADSAPEQWMWSVDDIEKELAPEDAAWWIQATGMKRLGNLPSEVDPRREFFRLNTLGLTPTEAEIAATRAQSVDAFGPRFEAAKAKLLAVRNRRLGMTSHDDCSHAGATFRMVSAYAAAFGATGDEIFRQKAVALLGRAQEAFNGHPGLRLFSVKAPDSIGAGRAFLYALALQAVIDVAAINSDDHWLTWAEDLATTAAELFTISDFLNECPDEAKLINLPITDLVMLFDDSTAGLISSAACRLAAQGRPLVTSLSKLASPLPLDARDRPVLHTDLLLATLARHYRLTVVLGANLSPALKLATERLPLGVIQHRRARPGDEVPAGSVRVLLPHGESRLVTTPEALQAAVLPPLAN